eukprot:gene35609-58588_t
MEYPTQPGAPQRCTRPHALEHKPPGVPIHRSGPRFFAEDGRLAPQEQIDRQTGRKKGPRMSFLQLTDVTKFYGSTCAVQSMNLSVEKGEFVSLLGPS